MKLNEVTLNLMFAMMPSSLLIRKTCSDNYKSLSEWIHKISNPDYRQQTMP